jgi:hypothetical protein
MTPHFRLAGLAAALLASCLAFPMQAKAALIQVGSRAALGSTLSIDWGVFGPDGTGISTPDSRTVSGVTVTVASSQGALDRHDEGTSFFGDFAMGDHLLTDAGSESDTFLVSFGSPVRGFGTQVDADPAFITGPFTGFVRVFSPSSQLLSTLSFSGTQLGLENDTAPFVGALSTSADIGFLAFFVNLPAGHFPSVAGALAINTLDVPVPVPASAVLLLPGLFGLAAVRRRR